jgi:orotate phosphoribosyltransferase
MAFCYKTYAEFKVDIARWLPHVPQVSAVAGVPRSGIIAACMISQLRCIPQVPIESLMGSFPVYRPSVSRRIYTPEGPVLVIDDTCSRGRTKAEIKSLIQPDRRVLWGAVYATEHAIANKVVDIAGYRINTPYHSFEWNLLRDGIAQHLLTDLDGVICPDWHRDSDYGEHQAEYERWLETVPPMHLPTRPVRAIVTARLERYRPQTERWLRNHGVQYSELVMYPGDDPRTRDSVEFKVREYRRMAKSACAFVESCPRQAREIASRTGWAVLCFSTGELHNPTPMTPLY